MLLLFLLLNLIFATDTETLEKYSKKYKFTENKPFSILFPLYIIHNFDHNKQIDNSNITLFKKDTKFDDKQKSIAIYDYSKFKLSTITQLAPLKPYEKNIQAIYEIKDGIVLTGLNLEHKQMNLDKKSENKEEKIDH